jgi:all-trans-retinol dehydrogenase (NAD+)
MFDGVKSPNPLFPILDPDDVAKRIVLAVKTNQKELHIPRQIMSAYLLRFLPIVVRDFLDEYVVKLSATMDEFKGQRALK